MGVRDTAALIRAWAARRDRSDDDLSGVELDGVDGVDRCEGRFHRCSCGRRTHRGPPHLCSCGGSWSGPAGGGETIVRLPGGMSPRDVPAVADGFDPAVFERALRLGYDPFAAAICASPARADRGAIEYRRDDGGAEEPRP